MSTVTKAVVEQAQTTQAQPSTTPVVVLPPSPPSPFFELQPFISCLVTPAQLDDALKSHFSQIYVATPDGYYKHMKLSGGRFVRLKVDKLPETKKAVEIKEEVNFLPAGKIPHEYWNQIVEFFRQVMKLKNADYEAHAWILWEPEKGYYISVPKQTVSKASVQFSYDQEALPAGAVIVVDIHSHNTMGAFYSSTDNNNDKNGIYYSGVVGKITERSYEWVMRFNLHDQKKTVTLHDIFDFPQVEVPNVPKAWLDQVQVQQYQSYQKPTQSMTRNGQSTGTSGTGSTNHLEPRSRGDNWMNQGPSNDGKWSASQSIKQQEGQHPFPKAQASLWDGLGQRTTEANSAGKSDEHSSEHFNPETRTFRGTRRPSDDTMSGVDALDQEFKDRFGQHLRGEVEDSEENDRAARAFYLAQGDDLIEIGHDSSEPDPVGSNRDEAADDERFLPKSENHDYYAAQFGEDCANAYDLIDTIITDMEGCDEGLLDIINTAFHLLTEAGQAKLQTNGIG